MSLQANVRQAVPFFGVSDIQASLRYYIDGLGFTMKNQWIDEGKLRWCWLERGGGALMLQELRVEGRAGNGVTIYFICDDALALYREFKSRGVDVKTPFVGNGMWVTSTSDPDGYRLDFESPTDAAEESQYSEAQR